MRNPAQGYANFVVINQAARRGFFSYNIFHKGIHHKSGDLVTRIQESFGLGVLSRVSVGRAKSLKHHSYVRHELP